MRIFRECDIRGMYPEEVNEALLFAVGNAIGERWRTAGPFIVAHDVRCGSIDLNAALVAGIVDAGANVFDVGCAPTPVAYFARRYYGAPVVAMITASHNPPEYNGLKLLTPDGPAGQEEIGWLRQELGVTRHRQAGGTRTCVDIWAEYIKLLGGFWDKWKPVDGEILNPRVVIDPGGGAWSKKATRILNHFGVLCTALNDEPDGSFRARSSDCAAPGSLHRLSCAVQEYQADAGLAWDGDGDRFAVVDSSGRPLSADQIGLIFAQKQSLNGEHVLLDVKISRKVSAEIRKVGGIPIIAKSAHCVLERTMIKRNCLFGCEYSGHYFFRDLAGADDGLYSALRLISILNQYGSLDSLLKQLPRFYVTPDIRVKMMPNEFPGLQSDLLETVFCRQATISRLDGLKLNFPEGWFLLRPSVSEDKLSFRAEGETAEDLLRIVHSLLDALPAKYEAIRGALESWARAFALAPSSQCL